VEWIDDLQGRTVGLDTAPLIYFIEDIRLPKIPSIHILSLDELV
jgi:hypothetical protein